MNIWFLNHYAGSVEYGMEFRHYYFAKELLKKGHQITILAASYSHLRHYNPEVTNGYKEEMHEGIRFVWLPTSNYEGNGAKRALSMLEYYVQALKNGKKIGKPDVIISSSPHPFACLAGIRIAKKMHCKNISEVRDLWPEALVYYKGLSSSSSLVKGLEMLEHRIYKKSDALIFTKEGDTDYLKEKGWLVSKGGNVADDKCYYINNGIDLAAFEKQIVENQYPTDKEDESKFIVTYIGTIREVNNVGMLLDAARLLKDKKNIAFRIYGDGEELPKLKQKCDDEHLDNVLLAGRVDKKYIPNILSKSSVNILNYSASLYNWTRGNSSNKLFEYMACGKPIISTVKMGYSILEKYACGVELDECTPECLAKTIMICHEMPTEEYKKMGRNAQKGSLDFNYGYLTEKLELVIESVI